MTISTKIGYGLKVSGESVVLEGKDGQIATNRLDDNLNGKIVVCLSNVGREFLEKAGLVGVGGVILPSLHWRDFEYFHNLNEFPLLILLKFGTLELSGELTEKLKKIDGKKGTIDGEGKTFELQTS